MSSSSSKALEILNTVQVGTGSFPQFTNLPPEIRSLIWEQSLCYERFIRVELVPAETPEDLLWEDQEPPVHRPKHRDSFLVVLRNKREISKLFRVCSESRQSAIGFYRVRIPCYYKKRGNHPVKGTFYFNPELDILNILDIHGLKYLPRFADALLASDPRHVGLINLGSVTQYMEGYFDGLFRPMDGDQDLVRQLLSRLRRVIFGYNGSFGREVPRRRARPCGLKPQLHRSRPIQASISKFQRLARDPRPIEAELTHAFLDFPDPRDQIYRWFRLLEYWQIEYPNHEVDYRYMITVGEPWVKDREDALEALRREDQMWKKYRDECMAKDIPCEEDSGLASAYGFWLFSIDAFGPIPTASDDIRKIGRTRLRDMSTVWKYRQAWNVSKHPPELCLQYLPEVPSKHSPKSCQQNPSEVSLSKSTRRRPRTREERYSSVRDRQPCC